MTASPDSSYRDGTDAMFRECAQCVNAVTRRGGPNSRRLWSLWLGCGTKGLDVDCSGV